LARFLRKIFQYSLCADLTETGILNAKGVRELKAKGWAITLGVSAAAGAVAVMMLPKQSTARKLVNKAAVAVENAASNVSDKLMNKMDM
jgi:hypothetical protein